MRKILAGLCFLTLASACGSSKPKNKIVIGLALPQSGTLTTGELYLTSATLALSHVKAAGLILPDTELVLEQADTTTTTLGAEAVVNTLIQEKGAKAIVAVTSSEVIALIDSVPRGAGPAAAKSKTPLMCLGCTAPNFESLALQAALGANVTGLDAADPTTAKVVTSGFVYRLVQNNSPQGTDLAALAAPAGARAAALAINLPFGTALVSGAFSPAWTTAGKTFVRLTTHEPTANAADIAAAYEAAVADADSGPIDALVVNSLPEANKAVMQAYSTSSKKPKLFFSFTGYSTEFLDAAGTSLIGAQGVAYGVGKGAKAGTFVQDWAKLRGIGVDQVATSIYVDQAYDAVMLSALAVASIGKTNPTGEEIKAALDTLNDKDGEVIGYNEFKKAKDALAAGKKINYSGASGELDFNDKNGVTSSLIRWRVVDKAGQATYEEVATR
jgi:branched-chain amino acid transport system substrate-binding protein